MSSIATPQSSRDRGALALAVLLAGTFMTTLDTTIVNVAAPRMKADLGLSSSVLQLVISGYSIAFAALLVTAARLGDDHGHRRLFLGGLATFTGASLLCGLAWGTGVLVAARIVQGLGAAAMAPQVMTVIQLRYEGEARARALGLYATVICAGAVAGQIVGGALVSAGIGGAGAWRPVFLVNVPIGLALLAYGPRVLPRTRIEDAPRLDLAGVALLTDLVLLVMVPLVFGHQQGWPWWTWACLALAVPTAAVLVRHLLRATDPVLDLRLLGRRPVALGLACTAAQMVAYGGFLFVLTLHLQQGLGYSPLRNGLTFGPYAVGFAVTSLTVPLLPARRVARVVTLGLAAMALGYAEIAVAARGGAWHQGLMIPLLLVAGAGFGAGYSPVIMRAVAQVPMNRARDASGALTTVVQLCFALGIATLGSEYLGSIGRHGSGHAFALAAAGCAALGVAATGLSWALTRAEASTAAGSEAEPVAVAA